MVAGRHARGDAAACDRGPRAGPQAGRRARPLRNDRSPAPAAAARSPGADRRRTSTREVEHSLDGLKDKLFRLELRRQAGTISEEEYARERSRTEEILRELVRG